MRRFIRKILLWFSPILVGSAALYWMPLERQYSYNQLLESCDRGNWLYSRIYDNDQEVDVALIGTSRMVTSVNSKIIQSQLTGKQVANLGFCRPGRNLHLEIIQDILDNKDPELIVLEVRETESRFSHPDFAFLADPNEVLFTELWVNQRYFEDIKTSFQHRLLYQRSRLLDRLPTFEIDTLNQLVKWNKHFADTAELGSFARSTRSRHLKLQFSTPEHILNMRSHYPLSRLEEIRELCDAHQVKLVCLYLPGYGSTMEKPLLFGQIKEHADVIIAPDSIFEPLDHWADAEHMNEIGAAQLSSWLAKEIRSITHNRAE